MSEILTDGEQRELQPVDEKGEADDDHDHAAGEGCQRGDGLTEHQQLEDRDDQHDGREVPQAVEQVATQRTEDTDHEPPVSAMTVPVPAPLNDPARPPRSE
ncbi:MAG: hypothetical protein P8172_10085 [Gammaproteobacteria bacterium]